MTTTPGSGYPDSFEYEELMASPNYVFAALTSLITYAAFISLALFSPVRYLLARFGPSPGEGPTVEQQHSGLFLNLLKRVTFV